MHYARTQGATHIADFATLTGAMSLALGDLYAGWFCTDEPFAAAIERASRRSGDSLCRFPLHPRYRRYIDSDFADMKNASELREGSPILAAEFLREFAGDGAVGAFRHPARRTSSVAARTTRSTRAAPGTACG